MPIGSACIAPNNSFIFDPEMSTPLTSCRDGSNFLSEKSAALSGGGSQMRGAGFQISRDPAQLATRL